jgi:hypothetical protein
MEMRRGNEQGMINLHKSPAKSRIFGTIYDPHGTCTNFAAFSMAIF